MQFGLIYNVRGHIYFFISQEQLIPSEPLLTVYM